MFASLVAASVLGLGGGTFVDSLPTLYDPKRDPRPIATLPGPEINGRLWVGRPMIGPERGPFIRSFAAPGPQHYGAVDNLYARVPVRVGHLVVSVSPWERIDKPGLRRFEEARQFWLYENNYTGGVRTFVNDRHLWEAPSPRAELGQEADPVHGVPQPRATIKLPGELPRKRTPLRVKQSGGAEAIVALSMEPIRFSWPMAAPASVVVRSSGEGRGPGEARVASAE